MMDALREQFKKPLVLGISTLVLGVFIGLVVLGWWLWPVKWTDAGPQHLRLEFKELYVRMAIDSYTLTSDALTAQQRLSEVGPQAAEIVASIAAKPGQQNPGAIAAFSTFVKGAALTTPTTVAAATPTQPAGLGVAGVARRVLPIMCGVTLLLALALLGFYLLRNRLQGLKLPRLAKQAATAEVRAVSQEPPLAQFMTTYNIGNDLYDDSFSIDSQSGEFLGECGVGISETIGVGEPKRVTAFEVWLFDKNDIQTVTQVLMSQHAFNDDATRQRLAAKGEPVLAVPGHEIVLETATLQLVARVVDMSYGSGAMPTESFFERLTLELAVWPKS